MGCGRWRQRMLLGGMSLLLALGLLVTTEPQGRAAAVAAVAPGLRPAAPKQSVAVAAPAIRTAAPKRAGAAGSLEKEPGAPTAGKKAELPVPKLSATATNWMQADWACNFPEQQPTSRIYARDRRAFKGYAGSGMLYVHNHGAQQAQVDINGQNLPLQSVLAAPEAEAVLELGRYTRDGSNSLRVLEVSPATAHLTVCPLYPELRRGRPEQVGFNLKKLQRVDALLGADVQAGFPGAVLCIVKDGRLVKETAYGWQKKYEGLQELPSRQWEPMRVETMFDLASNTKIYATVLALMHLTSEGRLSPDDLVQKYLPDFTGGGREKIRLRDLLTHSAGYEPEFKFHRPEAGALFSHSKARTQSLLNKVPLVYPLGSKSLYSDTDFILLGTVVEKVAGQSLAVYVEKEIYKPLGLAHTLFNPLQKGFVPRQFAATERCGNTRDGQVSFPGVRTWTLQGEVQDEKAYYAMEGVSGHAGLFSRAEDLAVLTQMILNGGGYGAYRLCTGATLAQYTQPSANFPAFGLGWNKGGCRENIWEFGPYASSQAIGHTGWTGIDIIIDPAYDLAVILLTNRVHAPVVPGKTNSFATDNFETRKYGSVMSLIYEAFLG